MENKDNKSEQINNDVTMQKIHITQSNRTPYFKCPLNTTYNTLASSMHHLNVSILGSAAYSV